jgi:hypothetical protein
MKDFMPFINKGLYLDWKDGIGYGVFTKEPIKKNEFVEISPVIVLDFLEDREMMKYVISWGEKIAMPMGWTMLYNHSDKNSCEFSMNIHDGLLAIVSLRDILAGEQLTVNYGPNWFSSRQIEKIDL